MAMYSPPMTPQLNPDVHEDLLQHLDQEIQATQIRHDEARRRLQHERRCATIHEPLEEQGQFDNADEIGPRVIQQFQHDYSFNLTGIMPPQPPKWKQVDHLYEDFKGLRDPVPMFLMDLWLMYQRKLRLICYFCGVDWMVKTFMKDLT